MCLHCAGLRALALDLDDNADSLESTVTAPSLKSGERSGLPERIGPYEIVDELGRGGMARVFAARQPRLDRLVALKVLGTGPTNESLEQRFLREIQTVARLRHPNIVAIHDSGRADGYVYFAMDYIEGGDFAQRLRARPLPARTIAVLLEKIAAALAYAHGEGVIHRDLKPSNILLDGDEPRLADFGLAAQLESGGDLTVASAVLGTPHYLAPEAVKSGSAALSAASDLYALGVILYEALAGRTPFAGASSAELPALLQNSEPPPLRLLAPGTPRDLETICLKCLERDPARRFGSADALAADLRHFLAGEPIVARPPGKGERFRRFARRHRTPLLFGGVAGGALVTATILSLAWAMRATQAERRAATEIETSRAIADFFAHEILLQASPTNHPDRDLKLRTVLDTAGSKIDAHLQRQPAVEAALRDALGESYHALGEDAAATKHFARALELRRQLGAEMPETWRTMTRLADTHAAQTRFAEAQSLVSAAIQGLQRVLGPDHPDSFSAQTVLARIYHGQDKLALALAVRRGLLERKQRVLGTEDPSTLETATLLATTMLDLGQFQDAAKLLEPTVAAYRRIRGLDDAGTLEALNCLAGSYWAQGRLADAEPLFREAIAAARRVLGPTHPDTCRAINNLAYVMRSGGKWKEALALYQEALAGYRISLSPDHQDIMRTNGSLGAVYEQLGQLPEARFHFEQCLALGMKTLGAHHPEVASARVTLAGVQIAEGSFAAAESLLRTAIEDHLAHDERPMAAFVSRSLLGACLTGLRRFDEAERELLAAHEGLGKVVDRLAPTQARSLRETKRRLAELYTARGQPDEALRWREQFEREANKK